MYKKWLVWVGLGLVIILAIGFRFYDIQNYPGGLFPDQAANGEDALLILDGDWRPFYERGNGREALFFYLQALMIWLFGIGVWPMFAASAVVGVLTVVAVYFATRPWFGKLAGLLAAGFLATSHWHVTLSRTGFRAIMIPLFVAAFTACVGYAVLNRENKYKSYLFAALAGAFFAGGFYTYIAYRVMVGVVLGIAIIWLMASLHPKIGWPQLARYWRQIMVGLIAAVVVFAPLGIYFWQNPEAFVGRAGQVSVFNPNLQQPGGVGPTILWSLEETLLSFFGGEGDLNWRHNVAGYPLLNPLAAILFLLGLAWIINGFFRLIYKIFLGRELHLDLIFPYLLLVIFGMLLPVITTAEGIPHGLRSIGLVAPVFMIVGVAGAVVINWLRRRSGGLRGVGIGTMMGLLTLGVGYDGVLYFVVARNDSEARYAYRSDLTGVSAWLKEYRQQYPEAPVPYLVLDKFSVQTAHFLTHEVGAGGIAPPPHDFQEHPDEDQHLYRLLEPARSHETVLQPGEVMIFTASTLPDAERYEVTHGGLDLRLLEEVRNRYDQVEMLIYGLPVEGEVEPDSLNEVPAGLDA